MQRILGIKVQGLGAKAQGGTRLSTRQGHCPPMRPPRNVGKWPPGLRNLGLPRQTTRRHFTRLNFFSGPFAWPARPHQHSRANISCNNVCTTFAICVTDTKVRAAPVQSARPAAPPCTNVSSAPPEDSDRIPTFQLPSVASHSHSPWSVLQQDGRLPRLVKTQKCPLNFVNRFVPVFFPLKSHHSVKNQHRIDCIPHTASAHRSSSQIRRSS